MNSSQTPGIVWKWLSQALHTEPVCPGMLSAQGTGVATGLCSELWVWECEVLAVE